MYFQEGKRKPMLHRLKNTNKTNKFIEVTAAVALLKESEVVSAEW